VYKLSIHSTIRYATRTGISIIDAIRTLPDELKHARPLSAREAVLLFELSRLDSTNLYLCWYVPRIKEHVLAIVAGNTVKTVLTECWLGRKRPAS